MSQSNERGASTKDKDEDKEKEFDDYVEIESDEDGPQLLFS